MYKRICLVLWSLHKILHPIHSKKFTHSSNYAADWGETWSPLPHLNVNTIYFHKKLFLKIKIDGVNTDGIHARKVTRNPGLFFLTMLWRRYGRLSSRVNNIVIIVVMASREFVLYKSSWLFACSWEYRFSDITNTTSEIIRMMNMNAFSMLMANLNDTELSFSSRNKYVNAGTR